MKHKDLRPWSSVIVGGESLVSHAGGVLLVETARRSGLARGLSKACKGHAEAGHLADHSDGRGPRVRGLRR